jgi:pimeloyl-ACP methyl ester carboxylesterase
MTTESKTRDAGTGQYADVNGVNLYYETHGTGRPVILLHGGLMMGELFGPVIPLLAQHHQVITPDLQGHGRTADIDRPLDLKLMAGDIAALIDHLGLDKPDLIGYPLGGGVALQTAVRYPAKIRRLVIVSANVRRDAIPPEMLAQQAQVNATAAEFMKDTPMYREYASGATAARLPAPPGQARTVHGCGLRFQRRRAWSPGADAHRRRRRRHGSARPLRRGVQALGWRAA